MVGFSILGLFGRLHYENEVSYNCTIYSAESTYVIHDPNILGFYSLLSGRSWSNMCTNSLEKSFFYPTTRVNPLSTSIKIPTGSLKINRYYSCLFIALRCVNVCPAAISGTALILAFGWYGTLHTSELNWCLLEAISADLWRYSGPRSGSAPQIQNHTSHTWRSK